jgi:signal transduction histidine kinase
VPEPSALPTDAARPVLDRITVECSALGFQAVLTLLLSVACLVLWRRRRQPYFLAWAIAWGIYVARLAFMSTFLVRHDRTWLVLHQAATYLSTFALLFAALQFAGSFRWRWWHALVVLTAVAWSYASIMVIESMVVAGISSIAVLFAATVATGVVLWRQRARVPGASLPLLAWTFILWGVHHLDYPLLRSFGTAVLYGVFVDMAFIFAIALGVLFLVQGEDQRALAARSGQLEQLTRLLLRAQEDERRRIARDLHDEAGQLLTAAKIELDLSGHARGSDLVGRALSQIRNLSNLLRPTALDLGLEPALRALADDFAEHLAIELSVDVPAREPGTISAADVVVYRVVQEALTNVARHARAEHVRIALTRSAGARATEILVEDDGRGCEQVQAHLGLLGMRERVTAMGGDLEVGEAPLGGFRVKARVPDEVAA